MVLLQNRYQCALPTTTTEKTSDSAEGRFNLEDAKREMREADQFDKAAYRERMKKLRQEKKAKLKKKLNEQRKGNEETSGGAVLDLADRQGDSGESGGEDAGGNEDLSWLPDPDKPKKYDEQWNEIVDDNADEGNEPRVEQRITSGDGDVTESLKKKKRKKEIPNEKMKKSQKIRTSNVIDAEAKALALLEGTN
ncbi:unnamed protein product [Anisakis simplex]|uniref:DUF2040 domain-containing protein n=1 Tax=Anisakis simplex TaxID=6269 RepID=A0A0M3KHR3_ANISI|nr:unnamed protein product [Anisakis simplex]